MGYSQWENTSAKQRGKKLWEPITANNTGILKENKAKDDSRYPYSTIYIIQFGDPSVPYEGFFH